MEKAKSSIRWALINRVCGNNNTNLIPEVIDRTVMWIAAKMWGYDSTQVEFSIPWSEPLIETLKTFDDLERALFARFLKADMEQYTAGIVDLIVRLDKVEIKIQA